MTWAFITEGTVGRYELHWKKYLGCQLFLPKKKLAFTDHLVIFTIFGGWVGPPHYKNSKKLLSDQ